MHVPGQRLPGRGHQDLAEMLEKLGHGDTMRLSEFREWMTIWVQTQQVWDGLLSAMRKDKAFGIFPLN
jgi:hypothetical protein